MGGYISAGLMFVIILIIVSAMADNRTMLTRKVLLLENGYTNVEVGKEISNGHFKAKLNGNEVTGVVVDDKIFLSK